MLFDVLQNYMDAVNGATRLTQRSATAMARTILIQAGMQPAADLVHQLSEQLIAAQDAQYAMVRQMVQSEVVMTMERMGLASPVSSSSQVRDPSQVRSPESAERTPAQAPSAPPTPAQEITEPTADARVLVPVPDQEPGEEEPRPDGPSGEDTGPGEAGKDPVADPAPTVETVVEPPARQAPAKKAPTQKAPAKKASAKKAPTQKAPAKKAPARKTASRPASAAKTSSASRATATTKAAPAAKKAPAKKAATRSSASRTAAKKAAPTKSTNTTDDNASS